MTRQRLSPLATRWLGATALATVLAIAPFGVTSHGPGRTAAWARGGGDAGHGGGGNAGAGRDGKGDVEVAARAGSDVNVRGGVDVNVGNRGNDVAKETKDRDDRGRVEARQEDRRDFNGGLGLGAGLGHGIGFGNVPVDPAVIEARANALDTRADARAAGIRAGADKAAADIIAKAESRAAELRAREATAKDPALLEARAVDIVAKANALAAEIIARADTRANALTARADTRVDDLRAIAAYDRAIAGALAIDDPTAQANAIAQARADLRAAYDRELSAKAIDRLDDRLGFDDTPPAVATTSNVALGNGS